MVKENGNVWATDDQMLASEARKPRMRQKQVATGVTLWSNVATENIPNVFQKLDLG
jgi:hypothetical protein